MLVYLLFFLVAKKSRALQVNTAVLERVYAQNGVAPPVCAGLGLNGSSTDCEGSCP